MKLNDVVILVLGIMVLGLVLTVTVLGLGLNEAKKYVEIVEIEKIVEVVEVKPMLTREEVTEYVRNIRNTGNYQHIVEFYDGFVGNTDLTYSILAAADLYNVPINTLFALIWAESGFNPSAVNGKGNKDGTNDKGLMQLNSRYFPGIDRLNPEINLQHGCNHLRDRFDKYGTWDEAIMYYNGFSQKAVDHQSKVLAKEREIDRLFHTENV